MAVLPLLRFVILPAIADQNHRLKG